ncbi:amino acid ABC transporter substrate-binding protein, partial [Rhizobium johnstonii]
AASILAKNPPKRPEMKFLINNSPFYIALNKEQTALLEKVNGIIAAAKTDGALNAISQNWLGADLPSDL